MFIVIQEIRIDRGAEGFEIGIGAGDFGPQLGIEKVGYGNGSQNADNGDHDQQLDQCESAGGVHGNPFLLNQKCFNLRLFYYIIIRYHKSDAAEIAVLDPAIVFVCHPPRSTTLFIDLSLE